MKLDHFVVNVDEKYQKDKGIIDYIRNAKLPYEPKWGKGTKGFKVSNLWIGNEYFEMVRIIKENGGGWIREWTKKYNEGHRGMICLMLDVEDIDAIYKLLTEKNIPISKPEWLEFKWFFNLFTRRMPWRNSYIPFFEGAPFQIGFQEMKDEKSRDFMKQYMVPNSRDNGIDGINKIIIKGRFNKADFDMILSVFENQGFVKAGAIEVELSSSQFIEFVEDQSYKIEIYTNSTTGQSIEIENMKLHC
ncbi:hypothetical protein [Clostridium sp. LP20]|uniref:hypothetical protein n=1 Tax=Clostridium sp. LP20 TaxID=3418665 RepID=UPI003EE51F05